MKNLFLASFLALLTRMSLAIKDPRPRTKFVALALGFLCGEKPKTYTSALTWLNRRQEDWSDDYRLGSQTQWNCPDLFAPLLAQAVALNPDPTRPIFAAQDDTLLRKSGKRIPGVTYARDPLSPPFQVNFVLGQRFLQTTVMIKAPGPERPWRSIPVSFVHAPPLKPPPRATPEQRAAVKEARKKHNLSVVAVAQRQQLRQQIDALPHGQQRLLIEAVDGSFANKTFLRNIPERTVVVARIRKNANLRQYLPPGQRQGPRKYGQPLPTPEQYLQQENVPWKEMTVFVAGKMRTLKYKVIEPVCWPKATKDQPMRLIIIKAAGYRLRKGSKLLYREPAYLICTSLTVAIEDIINAYLARWEEEVNFRDEKSGVGVGQAQVRNELSVERTPAFLVACYAALLLTAMKVFEDRRTEAFEPLPAWRRHEPLRPSLRDLITLLRKEASGYVDHPGLELAA
jgi:hypothetical protein